MLRKIALGLIVGAVAMAWAGDRLEAQQLPITADQLQQLQQMQQDRTSSGIGQSVTQRETILQPMAPPNPRLPQSRLEQLMSSRAGVNLTQFGYEQLGVGRAVTIPQIGAVQDQYVLGPGDEIIVSLRGQENAEYRVVVDRDWRVVLPRLNPIPAAGRTFGDFRRDLINAVHRAYVSTEGFVSIGHLKQISVLVSGEVYSPGVRILSGLSTAVDAILVSGGIKKVGSLRNVYIVRGDRRIPIDLYSVISGSARQNITALADGDRIVVPPLGRTVAVAGWVRRPGIYELPGEASSISTQGLLSLAGGLEVRGKYRLSVLRIDQDGRNQMVGVQETGSSLHDGEILFALPAASQTSNMATVSGGSALAGQYVAGMKLSEYLKSPGMLGNDPYTLFGIISRRDPVSLLRVLVPFTPVAVLKGTQDMVVQSDDIVRVISTDDARVLFAAVQQYRVRSQATAEALRNPQSTGSAGPSDLTGKASAEGSLLEQSGQNNHSAGSAERDALRASMDSPDVLSQQQMQSSLQNQYGAPDSQYGGPQQYGQPQGAAPQIGPQQYSSAQQYGTAESPYYQQGQSSLYYQQNPPQAYQPPQRPYTANLQEGPRLTGRVPTNIEVKRVVDLASQLRVDPLVLINFLADRSVNVDGAVQGPGLYLVGPDADIQSLLTAAGGVSRWADKSAVEVISTTVDPNLGKSQTERRTLSLAGGVDSNYIISPKDEVRVNEVFTSVGVGSVTVQGEVRHVGTYQIVRGEHLSDLLTRAGGLTENAYPYGTVFLRRSAAVREQEAFRREAQEIQDQLLTAMSRRDPNSKMSPDSFAALQGYINTLKNQKGLGRVTVAADPAVLAANPALDPLLEPGDVVYLPPRPYSVAVLGEVLQPGNVPFRPDMSARDYIDVAGGYSQFADKSETIVVLPDGTARRAESSWLQFGGEDIPPGSTIFVARDVSGVDLHQIIVDTTAIVSQLAVSAASLAVLSTQINK